MNGIQIYAASRMIVRKWKHSSQVDREGVPNFTNGWPTKIKNAKFSSGATLHSAKISKSGV